MHENHVAHFGLALDLVVLVHVRDSTALACVRSEEKIYDGGAVTYIFI